MLYSFELLGLGWNSGLGCNSKTDGGESQKTRAKVTDLPGALQERLGDILPSISDLAIPVTTKVKSILVPGAPRKATSTLAFKTFRGARLFTAPITPAPATPIKTVKSLQVPSAPSKVSPLSIPSSK